jgi:hypothetical protein
MEALVARIAKNPTEEVRIALTSYRGHDLVDARLAQSARAPLAAYLVDDADHAWPLAADVAEWCVLHWFCLAYLS